MGRMEHSFLHFPSNNTVFCPDSIHASKQMPKLEEKKFKKGANCKFQSQKG